MKIILLMPILIVGFTLILLAVKGEPSHDPEQHRENMTLLEKWQRLEKTFKGFAREGVKRAIPMLTENSGKVNLSKECIKNSMHLLSGLKDLKIWAVQFIDSSAKLWDGLLVGTTSALGSYEECLNIKVISTRSADKGKSLYVGQYCMIEIKLPAPDTKKPMGKMDIAPEELKEFSQRDNAIAEAAKNAYFFQSYSPRLAICTPSGCSKDDINNIVSLLGHQVGVEISVSKCEVKEENKYTPVVIGVITYYSFLTLLLIAGSSIGVYVFYTKAVFKNKVIRMLLAFSCITNFKEFTNRSTESTKFNCMYGIRFLTMTWIIMNHSYLSVVNRNMHGTKKILNFLESFTFQIVVNGNLHVDIFFFLGGLLLCYIYLTKVKTKNQKFSVWMYIVHRLWRLLPSYTFVLMFPYIANLLGSGPGWSEALNQYQIPCYDKWWSNFLFINNFFEPQRMCWYHTWYVAAEFQLYLFALVILIPMFKYPKVGVILASLTIFTGIFYSAINAYVMKHPPAMLGLVLDVEEAYELAAQSYIKPMIHAAPYSIGLLTGYLLYTKPKFKISPIMQVLGWCIAIICAVSSLFGTQNWNNGVEPTVVETIFYAGLSRTAFTLGIAWMVICCSTGNAGFINYLLSWEIFIPLGRITFLAYLIHPILMVVFVGNIKTEIQVDHFIVIWLYLGHLCLSYGLAFVAYMLVELPFNKLEGILLFPPKTKEVTNEKLTVANENYVIKEFNPVINGKNSTITQQSDVDCKC